MNTANIENVSQNIASKYARPGELKTPTLAVQNALGNAVVERWNVVRVARERPWRSNYQWRRVRARIRNVRKSWRRSTNPNTGAAVAQAVTHGEASTAFRGVIGNSGRWRQAQIIRHWLISFLRILNTGQYA